MIYFKKYLLVIISLLFACIVYPQNNSKSSLEKKKKKLEQEISMINNMLKETSISKKLSISQIIILKKKLEMREELIRTIQQELNKVNDEITQTQNNINALQSELVKLKNDYARILQLAQIKQSSKGMDDLLFIFSAQNFYQAYQRFKYVQEYTSFRKKQGEEIIKHQQKLQEQLALLQTQLEEKKQLLSQEEQEKQTLAEEKSQEEQELQSIQKKEKELRAELEKKKKQAQELQLAIKKLIEEEIKRKKEEAEKMAKLKAEKEKTKTSGKKETKITEKAEKPMVPVLSKEAEITGNNFELNKGKLPWPITSGFICADYGEYEHPAIKGFMMFNNGIELCSQQPVKVYAVFNGEVTGIALSPMGGKLVIIRHGEYLTVYSNLQEVFVKQGEKVNIKQAIGTLMHNDENNNYSLNFQVWKGQQTMNPKSWLAN
ncbi:MAG TPA: peptidoglycan DD-metalloendopeptidase family protein [Bacteroidia bacterium]|nr:peptidoglycan DD-metalloendopeptidase family protein [Bacteroidia bacterium]